LRRAGPGRGAVGEPLGLPVPSRALGRARRPHPEEFPGAARVILYPAIDLKGGVCVRLMHGRFDAVTRYDADPAARLAAFAASGAAWVHMVDLDGAEAGGARQHGLIRELAGSVDVRIQSGGGVRSAQDVERLLD